MTLPGRPEVGDDLSEFSLIRRFFSPPASRRDVVLGVGDDCALLRVPEGRELAVSIDTLVEGVHFLPAADPEALGHKALAVSLSDLAAMAADPAWATLALTLPQPDVTWLKPFSHGLQTLAERFGVQLVGGDTTRGPVTTITLQAHGLVPEGLGLLRSGAQLGDAIYVTGCPGDAALALAMRLGRFPTDDRWQPYLSQRLDRPEPRVAAGLALRGIATACIDVSDGLAADLGHILRASGVGGCIRIPDLPLSPALAALGEGPHAARFALAGGDDYELCFTAPPALEHVLERAFAGLDCGFARIGEVQAHRELRCLDADGREVETEQGYRHF
jgi:thiamine-monophosphate kinase